MMQTCVGSQDSRTGSNQGPASLQLFISISEFDLNIISSVLLTAVFSSTINLLHYQKS